MDNKTSSVGRGGRGAMLQAALQCQNARRPGIDKPKEPQPDENPVCRSLGRGAFLQSILKNYDSDRKGESSSKNSADLSHRPISDTVQTSPPLHSIARGIPQTFLEVQQPLGRGALLAKLHAASESNRRSDNISDASVSKTGFDESAARCDRPPPSSIASFTSSADDSSLPDLVTQMQDVKVGQYKGSGGKPLDFEVNYIWLKVVEGKSVHEYHVHFHPVVDSRSMKFKLIGQPQVKEVIRGVKNFDGAKLYLPILLEKSETVVTATLPTDNSTVKLTIKYIKKALSRDLLHMYNVLFKRIMRELKLIQISRNYFDPSASKMIPQHRLEIWPGWVFSIQDFEGGLMLNCDASFKVLRNVTARDIMRECTAKGSDMRKTICSALLHAVVLTRYNNKTYRVDDIDWDKSPKSTFATHDGRQISFIDYYQKSYGIEIQDTNQPMLLTRTKRKGPEEKEDTIYIVPELCFMTGLTDVMRSDFSVMKDMAAHTRITPNQRQLALQRFIDNINTSPEATKILSDWNLIFDNATVCLPGRVLDSEKILFREKSVMASPEADWSRDACSSKVLVPVNLENWLFVYTKRDSTKANDFLQMMLKVCPSLGIRLNEPCRCEILNDKNDTFCNSIRDNVCPRTQIVLILFPTRRDDRYNAVKKVCCIELPVPSQVVNMKTISNFSRLRSVTQKIVLQMNCKVGGELWALNIPLKNIMVCGIDAYHDASQGNQSILALVTSINPNLTRWYSVTASQKRGQEIGDTMKSLFISALIKYHKVNHSLPQKIFVFRDGVGDGMLEIVLNHEVQQMRSCFSSLQESYSPNFSFVVVQKRINTRMYERSNRGNPPPGSIVDHTVTSKRWHDFFLVSQHVRQGTVSPTHFVIVFDDSGLKPEHLQRLSYKMTHLYYNWSGTVRVPAPCLYAHKLAYLVGQNLHKEAHAELADKLFYL